MNTFDKYFTLFWDESEDEYSSLLYEEFLDMDWRANEIFVKNDRTEWLKIDSELREIILKGLLFANAIKQSIGAIYLPILNSSMSLEYVSRRAEISAIEAKLNGAHSQFSSNLIFGLNSRSLIEKNLRELKNEKDIDTMFIGIETNFKAMAGWAVAYEGEQLIEGLDLFTELNYHMWLACALAAILLEVGDSLPIALILNEFKNFENSEVVKGISNTVKDRSSMTTFFSLLANAKKNLLPKDRQEKGEEWIKMQTTYMFSSLWGDILDRANLNEANRSLVDDYAHYNLNKVFTKLNMTPIFEVKCMPETIEKMLKVGEGKVSEDKKDWVFWRGK